MNVAGKLVCITGGMGILGSQWKQALSNAQAQVDILDGRHQFTPMDVTDIESVWSYLNEIEPAVPDALICAAAIDNPPGTNDNGPWANWQNIMDVNLTGVKNCCEVIGSAMAERGRGSIILVSSIYGMVSPDNRRYDNFVKPIAYSATKAALYGLTKYLACMWGPWNVRVNAVSFGPMWSDSHPDRFTTEMRRAIPLGRFAHSGEYDGIIRFLVSDDSSYITGANIVVDGGYTAY